MEVSTLNSRIVERPNSFIFTLFGDLEHHASGRSGEAPSLWIGGLVRLMGSFGVSEAAVRQAVSRLSRQGWLVSHRRGTRAYYAVTARGRERIASLGPRIYGPIVEWDGRWRLLAYAVPERERERRDRLRKELAVLGWAPLAASLWISPRDGLDAARHAAQANQLGDGVSFFEATYRGPHSDRELLERCWDIPHIAGAYGDFIERYRSRLEAERAASRLDDDAAFVERLWLVHDYRKFTYVDPGLPSALLPAGWVGSSAASIFREYYALLERKATHFIALAGELEPFGAMRGSSNDD